MGTGRRRGIEILLLIIKENVNFDNLDSNQLEVIKKTHAVLKTGLNS